MSGVQLLTPARSFGSAPFAASARISATSPSRAAFAIGANGSEPKFNKSQRKKTKILFMLPTCAVNSSLSSTLCYKVQLQVDQRTLPSQPAGRALAWDEMHRDSFFRLAGASHVVRAKQAHDLGRDSGRRRALRQKLDARTRVAGLLFQLPLRRRRCVVVAFDETGRKIDDAGIDRTPVLLDENQLVVRGHRDHRRRFRCRLPPDELPAVALADKNVLPFEYCLHQSISLTRWFAIAES